MMKTLTSVILTAMVLLSSRVIAQDHITHFCGQVSAQEKLFQRRPEARDEAARAQARLEEETRLYTEDRGGQTIYIIPVVFHIIHQNGPENISDEQIYDAISILTRDFRKQNSDTALIVDAFTDIAADCGIEFRLATIDPNGNCHPGINRIVSDLTTDGGNPDMKALSYWPRNKYLNVWVCATIGDGVAGFTNLPGDVASNWAADSDGIVMRSDYVGSIGTSSVSKSRTLTHETGHWLNLYHTWGPTNSPADAANCQFDDQVTDTPNTIGYTSCTLTGASCGSAVDNVQNYMEYSYCSRMFTEGQRTRMRAALTSNTAQRNQLVTQSNLAATGAINPPLCIADFTPNRTSACVGDTITFTDESYHNVSNWSWDFGDGTQLSGSDATTFQNPTHAFSSPGVYNVTLTVGNGAQTLSQTQTSCVTVMPSTAAAPPLYEGFEGAFPGSSWMINNIDGDETWEVTPNAAFTGTKSLRLRNFSIDAGNIDELYSATFDMTGADTIFLSYKWAYANRVTETDDRFRISVSGDCGENWSVRKLRKGLTTLPTANPTNTQFTPSSAADWDGETLVLVGGNWFNDRFRVKFDFTSYGGNNLYLDDINILGSFPTGVREVEPVFIYNLYPNPSENDMTLELVQGHNEWVQIELYNAVGALCATIHQGQLGSGIHRLTVPHQAAGLYTVVLKKEGHSNTQKVIFK